MKTADDHSDALSRRSFGMLTLGAALTLGGCDTPSRSFRERLTIYIDTPEGQVSGSGVIEHTSRFQDGWLGGLAGHMMIGGTRGEATVVDLGPRGLLFALLAPDPTRDRGTKHGGAPGGYEYVVFADLDAQARKAAGSGNGVDDRRVATFIDWLNQSKPSGDVPFDILGLFVRFRDVNDPATVERVEPNDLAASFGAGVKLTRVTIAIVDEPLTTGIDKRLPWLAHGSPETRLVPATGGPVSEIPVAHLVTYADLRRTL